MGSARVLARVLGLVAVFALSTVAVGCAQGGGGASGEGQGSSAPAAKTSKYSDPPAGSALSKVELGWTDTQVRKQLGEPDNSNAYMTGKAWIPFYYGPDTHRTDWMYKGKGRVVFSRNRWSGALKVIRVLYNPNELE